MLPSKSISRERSSSKKSSNREIERDADGQAKSGLMTYGKKSTLFIDLEAVKAADIPYDS